MSLDERWDDDSDALGAMTQEQFAAQQFEAQWDEEKHPRAPAGSPDSAGGEFVSADSAGGGPTGIVQRGSYDEARYNEVVRRLSEGVPEDVKHGLDPEAFMFAQTVRGRAVDAEPGVTETLRTLVSHTGGELARTTDPRTGLPTMTKQMESLQRKIGDQVRESIKEGKPKTYAEVAAGIKDSVRYTVVFAPDHFVSRSYDVINAMASHGWVLSEGKNSFGDHNAYRGLNLWFKQNGVTVEVQLHTHASLEHAEFIHPAYEVQRRIPEGTKNYHAFEQLMAARAMSQHVEPKGWERLSHIPGIRTIASKVRQRARKFAALRDGWNVRFFVGDSGGLFRWDQNDDHLYLTQLNRATGEWDGHPPLLAVLGIGGGDGYTEISHEEAQKLAPGVAIFPEGSEQQQKFGWDEDAHPRAPAGQSDGGQFVSGDGGGGTRAAVTPELLGRLKDIHTDLQALVPQKSGPADPNMNLAEWRYSKRVEGVVARGVTYPAEGAKLDQLVKTYGTEKVALAIAAMHEVINIRAQDVANVIESGSDKNRGWLKYVEDPPVQGSVFSSDRVKMALALEKGWTAAQLLENTRVADSYSASGYRVMNGALRGTGKYEELNAPVGHALAGTFDRLLAQLPDVKGSDTFWRGMRVLPATAEKLFQPGGIYEEKGFTSASVSEKFATSWLVEKYEPASTKNYYRLSWTNNGGAKNATPFFVLGPTEGEVNYRPGTRWRVKSVTPFTPPLHHPPKSSFFDVKLERIP